MSQKNLDAAYELSQTQTIDNKEQYVKWNGRQDDLQNRIFIIK